MTYEHGGRVVVGVDGGPGSAGALRYGVEEARRTGAELHLVHVSPGYAPMAPMMPAIPVEIARAGKTILADAKRAARELGPGLKVTGSRSTGGRIVELVTAAKGARLLVVGRETRSGLERALGGGTTAAVAAHASVPVVAVPSEWVPPAQPGSIVVGLKSQSHAEELLGAAFRRAAALGAAIEVVHAWRLPNEYIDLIEDRTNAEHWVERGTELVEKELEPWRRDYPDTPVTVRVLHATAAQALVDEAREASLLMLVRRPASRVLGSHLGATGRGVLRTASCPVEVVPATREVTDAPGLELEKSGTMLR
jgi:nucleotide-binding universal stress UspA family protein